MMEYKNMTLSEQVNYWESCNCEVCKELLRKHRQDMNQLLGFFVNQNIIIRNSHK